MFDTELYVEYQEQRYGPYTPVGGPIPLNRYRSFKKTRTTKRAERIEALAKQLVLPSTAVGTVQWEASLDNVIELPVQSFVDPDPFQELFFPNALAAKQAIADYLGRALAKLTPTQMDKVNSILEKTLNKHSCDTTNQSLFPTPSGRKPCVREVMDYFGFERELDHLGFFATSEHSHLEKELQRIIRQGRLVALSSIVGCGKTTTIRANASKFS